MLQDLCCVIESSPEHTRRRKLCFFFFYIYNICFYFFDHVGSQLKHAGSTSLTRDRTPGPMHWEHGALATGPPGKSQKKETSRIQGGRVICPNITKVVTPSFCSQKELTSCLPISPREPTHAQGSPKAAKPEQGGAKGEKMQSHQRSFLFLISWLLQALSFAFLALSPSCDLALWAFISFVSWLSPFPKF